ADRSGAAEGRSVVSREWVCARLCGLRQIMKSLGIVIATRWEAKEILRRFHFRFAGRGIFETVIEGRPVLLAVSGVGLEAARKAAYRLCDRGAGELVSAGFCGALSADLQVGDLVTDRIATVTTPVRTRG